MDIKHFTSEKEFIKSSIKLIKNVCEKHGTIRIALSGGNTPKPLYEALSKENLPWDQIEFFLVDERHVALYEPESNCKMIFVSLIEPVKNRTKKELNFHYFDASLPIPKALKKYEQELPKNPFDLTILGIGPDGHTASLFPHSEALHSKEKIAHTQTDQFAIKDRLTLTFPPILSSKKILILLKNKPKILKELQNPTKLPEEFPANKLLHNENTDLTIHSLLI